MKETFKKHVIYFHNSKAISNIIRLIYNNKTESRLWQTRTRNPAINKLIYKENIYITCFSNASFIADYYSRYN